MREVIVVSTRNTQVAKFQVANDINFGQLKEAIGSDSYDWSNMTAVESINKSALIADASSVPNGDVKIFLRPTKTKSGVDIRGIFKGSKELQEIVKNKTGKNYTVVKNATLIEIYENYQKSRNVSSIELGGGADVALVQRVESLEKEVKTLKEKIEKLYELTVTVNAVYDYEEEATSEYDNIMKEFSDII